MKKIFVYIFLYFTFWFSVSADDVPLWYWWSNNTNSEIHNNINYNLDAWYWWTSNDKLLNYSWTLNQVPVWFFGIYNWKKVDFPSLDDISINSIKTISWWRVNNNCDSPESVNNLNVELKNDWYDDYLYLTWDNPNNYKIIVNKMNYRGEKYPVIDWENSFSDYWIDDNIIYKYTIITYSECFNYTYSDIVFFHYKKDKDPVIEIKDNYLYLFDNNNTRSKVSISCYFWTKHIYENTNFSNFKFHIYTALSNSPYSCVYYYLDGSWNLKSITTSNYARNWVYINIWEALDFMWFDKDEVYLNTKKYKFDTSSPLTYDVLSLLFINLYSWFEIDDTELCFDLMLDSDRLPSDITADTMVSYHNFEKIFFYYLSNKDINSDIKSRVNNHFTLTSDIVIDDFSEYFLTESGIEINKNDIYDISWVERLEILNYEEFFSIIYSIYSYDYIDDKNAHENKIKNLVLKTFNWDKNSYDDVTYLAYKRLYYRLIEDKDFYLKLKNLLTN